MKNYLNQLLVIAALLIVGCSDPCKDVVCGPGTCDDGLCICPDGYEGNSCETLENAQYYGIYEITMEECDSGFPFGLGLQSISVLPKDGGGAFDVTILVDDEAMEPLDGTLTNGKLDAAGVILGSATTFTGDFTDVNNFAGVISFEGLTSCDITIMK